MEVITTNPDETKEIAAKLAENIFPNAVILLYGNLGAGKTTFTQGFAKQLGIKRTVSSPTFTILKVYQGKLPLYHIDAYRLEGVTQDLGFEDLIYDDGVSIIEWPEYMEYAIPDEYMKITIEVLENDKRKISIIPYGERYQHLLEELK